MRENPQRCGSEFRLNSRRQVVFCKNAIWLSYSMSDLRGDRNHHGPVNFCAQLQRFSKISELNHPLSLCIRLKFPFFGSVDNTRYSQGNYFRDVPKNLDARTPDYKSPGRFTANQEADSMGQEPKNSMPLARYLSILWIGHSC